MFFSGILILLLLRRPCKISDFHGNPLWKKSNRISEKDRGEKLLIVATMFGLQCPRAVHALGLDQNHTSSLARTTGCFIRKISIIISIYFPIVIQSIQAS